MDFFRIECFLKAAEYRNMTKAAETMNITQPAMSFQIRQLEAELEMKLIIRDNRGINLTEEGVFLYNGFSQMMGNYNQLVSSAKQIAGKKRRLVIGFHGPFSWAGVANFIADFSVKHPETEIAVVKQQWKELKEYLNMGVIDAAFLETDEISKSDKVQTIHLFSEKTCFAVNRRHRLAGRASVVVDDIKDEKIFMNNHESLSMNALVEKLYRSGLSKENLVFSDNMEDTFAMAACSQGMASLPISFKTETNALKFVNYDAKETSIDYTLARSTVHESAMAEIFLEEAAKVMWPYVKE